MVAATIGRVRVQLKPDVYIYREGKASPWFTAYVAVNEAGRTVGTLVHRTGAATGRYADLRDATPDTVWDLAVGHIPPREIYRGKIVDGLRFPPEYLVVDDGRGENWPEPGTRVAIYYPSAHRWDTPSVRFLTVRSVGWATIDFEELGTVRKSDYEDRMLPVAHPAVVALQTPPSKGPFGGWGGGCGGVETSLEALSFGRYG